MENTVYGIDAGEQKVIGEKEIQEAASTLTKYKDGKANLERRIIEDELWYEGRYWEMLRKKEKGDTIHPDPTSEWLFNAILNKHADAMDNYPEPIVLPREKSDSQSADILSEIMPVVMEQNEFNQTYSDMWWDKLKHGTAPYGVFWNPEKENGLGDIDIKGIDILKIFWQPGITDIQESANLFITDLVSVEALEAMYPEYKGKLDSSVIEIPQYIYDDTVDNSDKAVVVDWYYKIKNADGKKVLHYCKFVGDCVLYASENDPEYRDRGYYDHGMYPVVFDTLFPVKGTPIGFGYVAICKDAQIYIDSLSGNILENSMMGTKRRYFVQDNTNINEKEFADWTKPFVHVAGELEDRRIREITSNRLDGIYVNVLQMKQEEMKETVANRDINSGGAGSGITAASAIAALQEAGNKVSRDMIDASFRADKKIAILCLELMRQFYDQSRSFRIVQPNTGDYDFVEFNNAQIGEQETLTLDGTIFYRKPIFDLDIKAQKVNPFSRMEENERAKEFYSLGFFNPENAQQALACLEMMNFEGKEKMRDRINEGATLLNICNQLQAENNQLKMMLGMQVQMPMAQGGQSMPSEGEMSRGASGGLTGKIMQAQSPMTSYGQRLAERASVSMD